jgi:hypothetical protein
VHLSGYFSFLFLKIKHDLDALFSELLPHLKNWALQNSLSSTFLSFILWDVEVREQQARKQVHTLNCVHVFMLAVFPRSRDVLGP